MTATSIDERGRVLLEKGVRQTARLKKRERLAVIPFKSDVILVSLGDKTFENSLSGFSYREELHEASRFLFKKGS